MHLEARLVHDLVNREIHPIRCAESCRRKGQLALMAGDLCAETGHYWWAMKVWQWARRLIECKDYDDWRYVWFNTSVVRLGDVVSEDLCMALGRRVDNLWRRLGHPEMAWNEDSARAGYDYLWLEKYDYYRREIEEYWDNVELTYEQKQETEAIFRDGLSFFELFPYEEKCRERVDYWIFSRKNLVVRKKDITFAAAI